MAFALPAAATAVAAAAPAAAAKATLMATLKSVAFKAITNLAISAAMSALQPHVGGQGGRTFEWTIDPDAPIPFAAGRVGVAGSVVHRDTFGPDLMYYGIPAVLSGAGPITGYDSVRADDFIVTFDGTGKAITSQYAGELWFKSTLGNQPDVALSSPTGLKNGAALPGWTSQHRLSGKAAYMVVMGENSKGSAFPTGEIKPLITFRGLKGWDPRLDSTYPGGSGSCRLDNPATWVYLTNPILWALKWSLGLWEGPTGKGAPQVDHQVGGIGAKLSGIDVPAFVAAANVADANGWTVSAYPNTDDDKHQVLEAFLQAGGAIYSQRAGKISCIQRAAPRTSIVTISAADTAGPLEIDTAASRIDRINTIRPRFWSPAHRWQMTAMDEVTAASYQTEDGGKRTRGIDYPFVSNAKQAGQLAALQIANTREGIAGVIPLKPHLQRIRPGDAFTITEPGFVLNGLKCLCLNTDYDPATGVVRVSFVSETDQKYPFALGQDPTPPEPQVLTPVDPGYVSPPLPGDWTIVPRPPAADGTQIPGFDLSGLVSNDTATAVIVEWGPAPEGPWTQAYSGPPDVTSIPIVGLQSAQTYYIAIRYQRDSNFSDRYVYGPYVAPTLSAGVSPEAVQEIIDEATQGVDDKIEEAKDEIEKAVDLEGLFGGQDDLAEAILKLGREALNIRQLLDQQTREDGVPVKVVVQQSVEMLQEADRVEGEARQLLAAELGEGLAVAEESISVLVTDLAAEANIRAALGVEVKNNRAAAESSISAVATNLSAEVTARQQLGVRVGNAEGAITSEASVRANADSVFTQNFNLMGARKGNNAGWVLSQSTVEINGEGTLSQVLSGLRATDGQNSSSITTLEQTTSNQASQLTTLSSTVGGFSSSISQLFSVTEGLGARWTLALNANGAISNLIADGQTRSLIFEGANFTVTDAGNGLSYTPATGRLKVVRGGMKTVLGAGSNLVLWVGSTTIGDGSENVDNGILGIGLNEGFFGGKTYSGPFDSGPPSATEIDLLSSSTVAVVPSKMMLPAGQSAGSVSFQIFVSGAPANPQDPQYGFSWSVVVTDQNGNLEGSLAGGSTSGVTPNTWVTFNANWIVTPATAAVRGDKRLVLRVGSFGSDVRTPKARNGRVRGLYAA